MQIDNITIHTNNPYKILHNVFNRAIDNLIIV